MPKRKGDSERFEVSEGITLSRTLIPALPPSHLSRKRLFPEIGNSISGSTLVIAPAGFGKTSLVSDWAQKQRKKVIWLTVSSSDSLSEMASMFIQATRNVIPGFAPWYEKEQLQSPVKIVRNWGNELLAAGEEFIFVLDMLKTAENEEVDVEARLIEEFPSNLHFISIRRNASSELLMTLHNRGPVSVIGENELRFTTEEIYKIAAIMNVEEITPEVKKSLLAANGWPSATTMLIEHVAKKKTSIDFEKIVSTDSNPLKALAMYMLRTIPPEEKSFLVKLSIVSEFTHELAEAILGKEYSYDAINQIAIKGTFFSQTSDPKQTFIFSELIREVLLVELRKKPEEKARIHAQLVEFYEERNQPNRVLEHAYLAGKSDKVGEIFPDAARVLLDTGKGDELLRWSIFAGDISPIGLLKRGTVELTGYLALGDYRNVKRLIETLRFNSQGTELESFISQFATRSQMYLDLKDGRFQEMVENFDLAFLDIGTPIEIGATEKIAQFRLKAIRSFILEEGHEVEAIYEEAKQLADFSRSESNSIFLSSMKAMALYESGDFRRAYEAAQISVNHARSAGYVGVMAPLETLYVIARCQLEFARPDDALRTLQEIRTLSENSKQWIWYFTAEGFIARHFVYQGRFVEALEVVKNAREFANEKNDSLSALWIIDLSEVLIRFFMRDHERLEVLLDRVPNTRFVQQVRFSYHERIGRKTLDKDFENLPAKTPHERMWKHLAEASINLDRESVAIKEMKKALEIGAVIGAKETFLRQEPELGNLIIKIAGESPTVYLEDLATAMTERIRLNTMESTSLTSSLTKREIEVLRHLSTERPISAIAATLHISLNTMKTHLKNLYRKMEVDGRVAAVEKARAHFIL